MAARRIAAHTPEFRSRRHAHASKEGPKRNDDSRKELRRHRSLVERDDPGGQSLIAVFRDESAAAVVPVIDGEVDREDVYLENVAGFSAFHVNRTRQDVAAGS